MLDVIESFLVGGGVWCKCHLQQYFGYIVAVGFIGGGNRRKPLAAESHWQSLSHNVVSSAPHHERDCTGSCKSNYHMTEHYGSLIVVLKVQQQIVHAYSAWEASSTISKCIQKWRRNVTIGTSTFDCYWKGVERWIGKENLVHCNNFNVPTQNLQKRSLLCLLSNLVTYYTPRSGFPYCNVTTTHPCYQESTLYYILI